MIHKSTFKRSLLFTFLCFWLSVSLVSGQSSIRDSLANLLVDSEMIEVYSLFFDEAPSDSLTLLADHIQKYIDLSEKEKDEARITEALYYRFRLLRADDQLDEALLLSDTIFTMLSKLSKPNIDLEIKLAMGKSIIYENKTMLEKAIEINYSLIDKIDKASQNENFNADKYHYQNYIILANNYLFDNDSLSYDYVKKAEYHARLLNNPLFILKSVNLSYYCNYFGNDGILLSAIADSCIRYAEQINEVESLGEAYLHKCNALVVLNRPDDAEVFCEKAVEVFSKVNDKIYLSSVYNNIANVFEKTSDPTRSLVYYEKAFEIAQGIQNGTGYLTPLNNLAKKYLNVGEYQLSAEHYKIFVDSQQVYYENLISSQFSEADAKFQAGQKEVEIANQKLQISKQKALRNRIIWGSSILFLLGIGLFQWYRNRQISKNKEAELQLEKERLEAEQLRNIDRFKTQFFTNVSHELRTPLTLISGPLKNILEKGEQGGSIDRDLSLAYSNSNKLHSLVSEILDLAKIESGKMKIRPFPTHLHSLFNRLSNAFSSYAEAKEVILEIQNRINQNLFVSLDADKFETIINNLLSNAVKFTDSGKKVIIDAAVSESTLLLYVKDEGVGIPKGDEEKIFERFYQSEQRSADLSGGTGVGLALSKEITELLGGKISAVNNITEGCTLTLVLPLVETTKESIVEEALFIKEEQVEYLPILINGERPRILIVEDNKDMREYISSILDPYYECSFASDGYECLKMIQRETFDIISSDVMMPRMDGFTLKSKINQIERLSQIPFIFLTARILEEDKIQGLNLGVDDYITKPFSKREYLTRIHNLLKNKKAREEDDESVEESVDRRLLKKAESWVLDNLDNTSIKVQDLADELNTSQRQLSRNIKKLTGFTPVNFILEIRLQKAYQLILEKRYSSVAEVRFEVGIESASYFTRKFKERFGLLPSEVR